jgi:hypothetical protein
MHYPSIFSKRHFAGDPTCQMRSLPVSRTSVAIHVAISRHANACQWVALNTLMSHSGDTDDGYATSAVSWYDEPLPAILPSFPRFFVYGLLVAA